MRRVEIREQYAVHGVSELGSLARIARLHQHQYAALPRLRRVSRYRAVSGGIHEHLDHFVAGGKRPVLGIQDQGERLAVVVVQVNPLGIKGDRVVDDDGPVAQRNIVETREGIDTSLDIPDWANVPRYLLLNGGSDRRQIRKRDLICLRNYGNLVEHSFLLGYIALFRVRT